MLRLSSRLLADFNPLTRVLQPKQAFKNSACGTLLQPVVTIHAIVQKFWFLHDSMGSQAATLDKCWKLFCGSTLDFDQKDFEGFHGFTVSRLDCFDFSSCHFVCSVHSSHKTTTRMCFPSPKKKSSHGWRIKS